MSEVSTFLAKNFAVSERPAVVTEAVSEILADLEVSEYDNQPIEAQIDSVQLENTVLASFDLGAIIFDRDNARLQDGDDRFSLVTCVGGSYDIGLPDGSLVQVQAGMAGLVSHRLPSKTIARGFNQEKTLVFPRRIINHALRNPDERIGAVPEGGMVAIKLMASYMSGLLEERAPISPKMQKMIEGHVLDLVANAYDPGGDWSRAAPNDGVNAAQLQQILAHLSENFAEKKLNAEMLAEIYGLSPRKVHNLLSRTGQTLTEHLLEQRLQAARQALQNDRVLSKSVSEIALDSGFSDVSYFNRRFRQRFGDTPSGFRPDRQTSTQ
jgi:AraC-like DNA-binding protein